MMTNNVTLAEGGRLDRFGIIASCVCAVHCAVMPALVGLLPLLGLGVIADERVEWTLVAVAALVGMASLLPTYFRHHGRATPLLIFAAGLTLIFVGKTLFEERATLEAASVVAGALTVAIAHFVNRRLCRACCTIPVVE
ncbi:MAG: MerC domain-containing protein [Pyrinomonadaceae bacterium MAG19_C2-C3]|nr:MerC domain-containing protein [Pyrinomonadaceae bacterium MAG19_C2-C3]